VGRMSGATNWAALRAAARAETGPVAGAGGLALDDGGGWMLVCTLSKCPPGLACIALASRDTTVGIIERLFAVVKSG